MWKLQPVRPSQATETSSQPHVRPQEVRLPLLVLASTFPKSSEDNTPAFVLELSKHLQSWFEVVVSTPAVRGAADRDEIEGVQVRRFHYFWPRSLELLADGAILENVRRRRWLLLFAPFLLLFEFIAAYRQAHTRRPAVIHAHWFIPQGMVAVIVGALLKVPVVITSHGGDIYGLRGRVWSVLRKALASRAAAVTVVSRDMAASLPDVRSQRGDEPRVMPMGVDTGRFKPGPPDEALRERLSIRGPSLLFVGRLAEKKGVRYLLEAMPEVIRYAPRTTLVIAGDGPLRGQLQSLAKELGVSGSVRFIGGVSHQRLSRYYATADIFVAASVIAQGGDMEGLPVVLLEALSAGRPVVATPVGGIPEVVVHRRTGLLVEPASARELAEAINELLASPEKANRMGALARRWVRRRFDWRNVAAGYAGLLMNVVKPQGDGPRLAEPVTAEATD